MATDRAGRQEEGEEIVAVSFRRQSDSWRVKSA